MKFTCIIIDDEPPSHEVLKSHLATFPQLQLIGKFFNAKDAAIFLETNTVDLLFLDIQMPEINGLDFLRSLNVKPVSIITTAYRNYALEGFELGVIDYLLKPIYLERFQLAVNRSLDFLNLVTSGDTLDVNQEVKQFEILIKTGTKKILLDFRTINFAQGLKDYTILHTDEIRYVVKGSVKTLQSLLPKSYFERVHKSFIVAHSKIKVVHKNKIELDNISIPVGRYYKEAVEQFLHQRDASEHKGKP